MSGRLKLAALAACAVGSLGLTAAAPAGAVTLQQGDIVVVDPGDFSEPAKLIKVDPATGEATLISDNSVSGPNLFQFPQAVDATSDGTLLVTNGNASVLAVDPETGQQSVLSDNTISGPNLLSSPIGIKIDPTGRILVTDEGNDSVVAIDRATGQQSLVTDDATSANDLLALPYDIDFQPAQNRIVVADFLSGPNGNGQVIGVDTAGQQTAISNDDINTGTDYFGNPKTLTVDNSGQILSLSYSSRALVRIDGTGQQILISNASTTPVEHFFLPFGVAVEESGRILVADTQTQGNPDGNVIAVDPTTGDQTVFSDNTISTENLFFDPEDIMVMGEIVPPVDTPSGSCGGRAATIVGTNAGETLRGTPAADVIAGLGGGDVIRGLAGNDRLCGGRGKDRLVGGKGRDRLLGGPGPDVIRGGPGRDVCRGGPGRDLQRAC